jgi:hypothetical protein
VDESDAADAATWYRDADGDGYGDVAAALDACTCPSGYAGSAGDCDDASAAVNPGELEICDRRDNDCDGTTDGAGAVDAATWYRDADSDGYGDPASSLQDCTQPAGYLADRSDCDDGDGTVFPGAPELCDSQDNDCDGATDEGAGAAVTWCRDADGDGYGNPAVTTASCAVVAGYDLDCDDCDDGDAAIHPGAVETCDGEDDDCDGTTDEADASDAVYWYRDADSDGWGDAGSATLACTRPSGYAASAGDCDDGEARANPGEVEVCDGLDDDCDGTIDEPDASDATTWYVDADGDGYGDSARSTPACTRPSGYAAASGDCDDLHAAAHPGGSELCDGLDNDCDGSIDAAALDADTWCRDADGDGYGNAASTTASCSLPSGYVADCADCADSDASMHPGATETCDGSDEDCDGTTDEADASDAATWYRDADGDGFGDPAATSRACTCPAGWSGDARDCDDADASAHPGAIEACDGDDEDCDGLSDEAGATGEATWYEDADGDGYGDASAPLDACDQPSGHVADDADCDDGDRSVHPGASESCDGDDEDCDGLTDEGTSCYDDDGDGFTEDDGDCDDAEAEVSPAAVERCDGVDDDCDGQSDEAFWDLDFDTRVASTVMSLNGSASQVWYGTDGYLELTTTGTNQAGTAFFIAPIPGDRFCASFDVWIGGGSGGDGLSFAFLEESDPTLVGDWGEGLGVSGLNGFAVELDTYLNSGRGDPDGNHVAVVDAWPMTHLLLDASVPTLDSSSNHLVDVCYDQGLIDVEVDGAAVLSVSSALYQPAEWLVGVTAGTGSNTDYHVVDDLYLYCP